MKIKIRKRIKRKIKSKSRTVTTSIVVLSYLRFAFSHKPIIAYKLAYRAARSQWAVGVRRPAFDASVDGTSAPNTPTRTDIGVSDRRAQVLGRQSDTSLANPHGWWTQPQNA